MPRGPRIAFPNSFHHVFNRGINKQPIFLSVEDYYFFLAKLHNLKNKYDHSIYAYCLMPNHFHISIQTRKVPISKIMSSLSTSYSMYFNRKYTHYGPVFQNRFKSILIEDDTYFLKLSQYIYLNPVKAKLIKDPIDYQFSSLGEALGHKPLHILDQDIVRLIGNNNLSQKSYQQFIYDGAKNDFKEMEKLFQTEQPTLGSEKFATRTQRKYLRRKTA